MSAIDITIEQMVLVYLLLILPISVFFLYRLDLIKRTVVAVFRMTAQLVLVGIYMKYLFEWNSLWVNGAWVLVMLVAANLNIIGNAGLSIKKFFPGTLLATGFSTIFVAGYFLIIAVQPSPLYDARYLIPVFGMLLGNCLRANIVGLQYFFEMIKDNRKEFKTYLYLGASLNEACLPYIRGSLRASLSPHVATMATIGIVSLPGMMTGQILGGGDPILAIKYQMAIMVAILVASSLGTFLNLQVGIRFSFDEFQRLRPGLFASD